MKILWIGQKNGRLVRRLPREGLKSAIYRASRFALSLFLGLTLFAPIGTAHVHGEARLSLVQAGERIVIEWRVAAYDILGFERELRTEAERQSLEKFKSKRLKDIQAVEFPRRANCTIEERAEFEEIVLSSSHRDFLLRWSGSCERPSALRWVRVHPVENLPSVHRTQVALIGEQAQNRALVRTRAQRLYFNR
ncbi:MAG: DUF2796 domain-containing protein [Bradymonadales bacterium]|nr:MAG: DUF2796 domain-containing protein [Bradymonadales bacterium]